MWPEYSSHQRGFGGRTHEFRAATVVSEPPRAAGADRCSVGAQITKARKARGLNRNQLARKIGTSWALVDRWEKDRTVPSVESLNRLAEALDVGVDQLLGKTTPSRSPQHDEALDEFLRAHAPRDLSREEQRWLEAAPVGPGRLGTKDYVELLHVLRSARSGDAGASRTHEKVLEIPGRSE